MYPHLSEDSVLKVCDVIKKNIMSKQKKIIIVAGEESGDMYASKIINDFSENEKIQFYGMGSNKMKKN